MNPNFPNNNPNVTSLVLQSIQKVQRGLEVRNIKTGSQEETSSWSTKVTAHEVEHRPAAPAAMSDHQGKIPGTLDMRQDKVRESQIGPSNNLSSVPPSSLTNHQNIPASAMRFNQAQNVLSTTSTPVGIINQSTTELLSLSDDSLSKHNRIQVKEPCLRSKGSYIILLLIQITMIILYAIFVRYDDQVTAKSMFEIKREMRREVFEIETTTEIPFEETVEYHSSDHTRLMKYYPLFQDVHVMIFIGFGFLMTFLRKYGYSAVGYNMLIGAIAIQFAILCRGAFINKFDTIPVNLETLINGDFAAASVLITYGAILGVANPLQLIIICLIEVFLFALNEHIIIEIFGTIDIGGSLVIHTFGAYFGLALSFVLRRQSDIQNTQNEEASTTSDLFAMIGTVFLWLFWPSFNGALAQGDDQHRAVINTVLSLCGSCIISFAFSALFNSENKFSMVHVQNATLAGGVAVGATADLMLRPYGSLLVGCFAGALSTLGYVYVTPFLNKAIGLHDTCGVHNLHGMPGILAGIVAIIMAAIADEKDYGESLYLQYPARAPREGSQQFKDIQYRFTDIKGGEERTASTQALFHLAALGVTLGIALLGGALTGLLLRASFFGKVPNEYLFDDSKHWEIPPEEEEEESHKKHGNQSISLEMGNEKDVTL